MIEAFSEELVETLGDREPVAGAIDCDVHVPVPKMSALVPYLDAHWAEQVVVRGIDGLVSSSFPPTVPALCRPDWRQNGASDPLEAMRRHALEAFGSSVAICNCLYPVQAVMDPNLAVSLASSINDWMATEWLSREPRMRASVVVTPQDPEKAAAEIDRLAPDRRFVQVLLLAMGEIPLGKRWHWPIYAAAERCGMPIAIHAGSDFRHAPFQTGWPSFYVEEYMTQAEVFQAQILSMVSEGVFAKFPSLRVVLLESGFTWMPAFMWRADKTWRGTRAETPWVDRPPSEIVRQHVRIALQPADTPPQPEQVRRVLEHIDCDDMLLFATDYPHWHFDGRQALPLGLSRDTARRICISNPLATYSRLTGN